jgi:hypothetical protein
MANIKHFADTAAGTIEFARVDHRKDGAYGYDHASKVWVKTNRTVAYKAFASKHECDARCMNASGRAMNCECACGGKNHGKGAFNCSEAA